MISVIFPVYNEKDNLNELYYRLAFVSSEISGQEFEFIFVDDCSSDGTSTVLKDLRNSDDRVKVVRFSKNFGSHAALRAGLQRCKGDCAIVMAADLQDPPELIGKLLAEWDKNKRVVWGARTKREGEKASTNMLSRLYYCLINWLTDVKMPPLGADVFLVDRVAIDALKKMEEKHTSVFVSVAWLGFEQATIWYVKEARFAGKSKWTLGKKVKLAVDSMLAFSDIPIRYMSFIGVLTAISGFIYSFFIIWLRMNGSPVEGWSSIMCAILIIGGLQMVMLGVLGEYLWRTYDESRKRPKFIIDYTLD